ncbi:hypothetical protein L249_7128 [Ophiocordyceps polyrhachis-furcata BCC 54312]|uniref:Uncharacterized protein n=1 Tax=Ophiocordyceps polyrhachis-furcata BCC 54312 TaxID=1330021 RepID=A0A367LAF5_9HYPO|nr:hypothetical protein L249_7128 [Ophiocordyceps polyrhachis-furcata BCC 54312]
MELTGLRTTVACLAPNAKLGKDFYLYHPPSLVIVLDRSFASFVSKQLELFFHLPSFVCSSCKHSLTMFCRLYHRSVGAILFLQSVWCEHTGDAARPSQQAIAGVATSQVPSNGSAASKFHDVLFIEPAESASFQPTVIVRNSRSSQISTVKHAPPPTTTDQGTRSVQSTGLAKSDTLFILDDGSGVRPAPTTTTTTTDRGTRSVQSTGLAVSHTLYNTVFFDLVNGIPSGLDSSDGSSDRRTTKHAPSETAAAKGFKPVTKCNSGDPDCFNVQIQETVWISDGAMLSVFVTPSPIVQTRASLDLVREPVASLAVSVKQPAGAAFICPFNRPNCYLETSSTTVGHDAAASLQIEVGPPVASERKMVASDSNHHPVKERPSTIGTRHRENSAASYPPAILRPTATDNKAKPPFSSPVSTMVGEVMMPNDRDSSSAGQFRGSLPLSEEGAQSPDGPGGTSPTSGERRGRASQTVSNQRQASHSALDLSEQRPWQASQTVSNGQEASHTSEERQTVSNAYAQASPSPSSLDAANKQQASFTSLILSSANAKQAVNDPSSSPASADQRSASLTPSARMRQTSSPTPDSTEALQTTTTTTTASDPGQTGGVGGRSRGHAGLVVAVAGLLALV